MRDPLLVAENQLLHIVNESTRGADMNTAARKQPSKRDLIVEEAAHLFYERGTFLGVDVLVDEIERRLDTVGSRLVESCRTDILDCRVLDSTTLYGDVLPTAQRNVEELLTALREDCAFNDPDQLLLFLLGLKRVLYLDGDIAEMT